jgi:succinate dehydrogenase/fumarate reductase flavoprotein subunit
MSEKASDEVISGRREFTKGAAVSAGAVSLEGLSVSQAVAAPPSKWDEEADVIVVGYGGAGAVTAIESADAGATVIVLEKNPADAHFCNTNVAGGVFISPTDPEKAFQYVKACIGDTVDDAMCRVWAEQTSTNRDYLKKLADSVGEPSEIFKIAGAEFPDLPGAEAISLWVLKSGPGAKMFEILDKCVRARNKVRVEYSTPGRRLVQGRNGEVLGVIALRDGKEVSFRGRLATVLASGGYEYNEQMKLNSFYGNPRYFYGPENNTGDGLLMAMAVGADLWHMNWSSQHYGMAYKNFPVAFNFATSLGPLRKASYMIVDQYGRRFFDESYNGHSSYAYFIFFDPNKGVYPRIPSYVVFDEAVRTMGAPLSVSRLMPGGLMFAAPAKYKYFWSNDQSKEIEKGWIMKADTVGELAQAIRSRQGPNEIVDYPSNVKIDPAVLISSVETFNRYAKQGLDPEFGRKAAVLAPIERPPFYATEIWPVGPNTQGGPKFDVKGRVLDAFGKPIPRLYKCGELGSIYGQRYPSGGGNIAELLAFGRIVGQNAAAEAA